MKYSILLVIIVITILLLYAFQAKREALFHGKKTFSNLIIETKAGQKRLLPDSTRPTIIIWFKPECEKCQYQLTMLNKNIVRLDKIRFFFISADTNLFKNEYASIWPNLTQSQHVSFGIIDKSRFVAEFGPVVTPSLLFFNQDGTLKEILYGEVKFEKIVHLVINNSKSKQTISGSN